MEKLKLYKTKDGKKLYPICSWERNQHKLYNAHDIAMINFYDGKCGYSEVERTEKAIRAFDAHVHNGLVYATWEDGQLIKDYVWGYDARH